ncbi:probable phytol kinase 3, chloroplastic [Coffea eugenioides]|uniref:Probable phytol kinase 3, chloroplastic n=1 Tax=Coffea arabica TaxID=13443 RepID=A0A6P6V700_COFAR|nr:probable phytol kinase 3, chloroplastic [Coffea eugenioides]
MGLVFTLCWPRFSSGNQGGFLAAMVPGFNAFKLLLLGLEMRKDEKAVKLMSGLGDHYRQILKASFYYLTAISLASVVYWRTSPVAVAAVCKLCAGDRIAPIVGRRFGSLKLPYNKNKSVAGIIAMVAASFLPPFSHYQNLMYSSLTKKVAQQVDALFLDIWVPSRKLENGTQILCGLVVSAQNLMTI